MALRSPITLITGALGSGKTTLLRNILAVTTRRVAILMNEFGEIAIDSKVIEGKNVRIAELGGGCVCCSLIGEFEAAVKEIIEKVEPEIIVVETTGVAEPDALVFDIQENLPMIRLDGVITIVDCYAINKFPRIGHTEKIQIEAADVLLMNKTDLVDGAQLMEAEAKIRGLNQGAIMMRAVRCDVDPNLLFGLDAEKQLKAASHQHRPEMEYFVYSSNKLFDRDRFEALTSELPPEIYRAKGFVRFQDGSYLFNYVVGRWDLEEFRVDETQLVFIGKGAGAVKGKIMDGLARCEV